MTENVNRYLLSVKSFIDSFKEDPSQFDIDVLVIITEKICEVIKSFVKNGLISKKIAEDYIKALDNLKNPVNMVTSLSAEVSDALSDVPETYYEQVSQTIDFLSNVLAEDQGEDPAINKRIKSNLFEDERELTEAEHEFRSLSAEEQKKRIEQFREKSKIIIENFDPNKTIYD